MKDKCSICLKEDNLSVDHIPPKCCGNISDSFYINYTPEYLGNDANKKMIHSQNGIKFKTICPKCNSDLGAKYDTELEKFYKYMVDINNGNYHEFTINILLIVKSIIGHLLAAGEPDFCVPAKAMRKFYLSKSNNELNDFCLKYSLFCLNYPYKESIFIMKNFVPVFLGKNIKKIESMISCLYFYPFAFIFTDKQKFDNHCDLLNVLIKKENLTLQSHEWIEINGQPLHPTWPAVVDDNHCFIISASAKDSIFKKDNKR